MKTFQMWLSFAIAFTQAYYSSDSTKENNPETSGLDAIDYSLFNITLVSIQSDALQNSTKTLDSLN